MLFQSDMNSTSLQKLFISTQGAYHLLVEIKNDVHNYNVRQMKGHIYLGRQKISHKTDSCKDRY